MGTNRAGKRSPECRWDYREEKSVIVWLRRIVWFGTKVVYVCTPVQNVHQSYGGKHNPGCSMQQVSIHFFHY